MIRFRPLAGFGIEAEGVDLSRPLADADFGALEQAFYAHHLLALRAQEIDAAQFIAFCFLVVGCFLDAIPAIIIVGTILEPLAKTVGMDPVHFAMIGIVSLAFGLVTPPYGLCLMISCAIAKVRLMYVIKDVMIMLLPMLGVLALTIVFPEIILVLPRLISPEFLK